MMGAEVVLYTFIQYIYIAYIRISCVASSWLDNKIRARPNWIGVRWVWGCGRE